MTTPDRARRIALLCGDISATPADAIVNAANSALQLGAGVAGALRARAGPSLQEACDAHGPIAVGEAARTDAGALPARHVLHAAGMVPGQPAREPDVRAAFRAALELARAHACRTLTAPAIGAGVGGLTTRRVAELLLAEARAHLAGETTLEEIRFVLFDEPAYRIFEMVNDAARIPAASESARA